jgi:hypothetical protein
MPDGFEIEDDKVGCNEKGPSLLGRLLTALRIG